MRTIPKRYIFIIALLFSCGGNEKDSGSNPLNNNENNSQGFIEAKVDDQIWRAEGENAQASRENFPGLGDIMVVFGAQLQNEFPISSITLFIPFRTGEYSITPEGAQGDYQDLPNFRRYVFKSGKIVVESITDNNVEGTFSGLLRETAVPYDTLIVGDGKFSVDLTSSQ